MLAPVDELQCLSEVVTCKEDTTLRLVCTTVVELDEGNNVLECPCAAVLNLALNLPAYTVSLVVPLVVTHA